MVHSYVTSVTFSIFLSHTDSKLSFMALPPPVQSFIHLRVKSLGLLPTQDFLTTYTLTLLHSEWPKLHRVLAILSAIGLISLQSPLYYNALIHNFPPFQRDTNYRAWHWKIPHSKGCFTEHFFLFIVDPYGEGRKSEYELMSVVEVRFSLLLATECMLSEALERNQNLSSVQHWENSLKLLGRHQ